MRHVSSPVLRRLVDEPLAVPDRDRRHLAGCGRCQAESSEVGGERRGCLPAAGGAAGRRRCRPGVDHAAGAAAGTGRARAARHGSAARRMPRRLVKLSLGTGTAVAAGVVAVGVGAAAALNSIYAPTHVAPVTVSPADLAAVENIAGLSGAQLSGHLPPSGSRQLAFGEVSWTSAGRPQQVSSIARPAR